MVYPLFSIFLRIIFPQLFQKLKPRGRASKPLDITFITLEGELNSVLIKYTNFFINRNFNRKLKRIEIKKSSTDEKNYV